MDEATFFRQDHYFACIGERDEGHIDFIAKIKDEFAKRMETKTDLNHCS
jgi:hypothetical protein